MKPILDDKISLNCSNLKPYDTLTKYVSEMYDKYPNEIKRYHHFMKLNLEATVVEIDNNLIPLIKGTKNKIFYRPLFFKYVFINTEFEIFIPTGDEGVYWAYVIKGIGLIDMGDDWQILILMWDPRINCLVKQTMSLQKYIEPNADNVMPVEINKTLNTVIKTYACNVVDFVENQDMCLDLKKIIPTTKRQEKRKQKHKRPIPTRIIIKPKKHFIQYVKQFNKDHSNKKLSHKFMVRGHWRRFRNKKYSELKRRNPTWIKPYYKGEGILINKSYLIKDA